MTERQILEAMGNIDKTKPFERREWNFKSTIFFEDDTNLEAQQLFPIVGSPHKQWYEGNFPYNNKSVLMTHALVTHNLKFDLNTTKGSTYDELLQPALLEHFQAQSYISFKTEFTDNAGRYWLRNMVERTVVQAPSTTDTAYLQGRDNRANAYPLQVPLVIGAGKSFDADFTPATKLKTRALDIQYTPFVPDNTATSGDLSTSDRGYYLTLWLFGYLYTASVSR